MVEHLKSSSNFFRVIHSKETVIEFYIDIFEGFKTSYIQSHDFMRISSDLLAVSLNSRNPYLKQKSWYNGLKLRPKNAKGLWLHKWRKQKSNKEIPFDHTKNSEVMSSGLCGNFQMTTCKMILLQQKQRFLRIALVGPCRGSVWWNCCHKWSHQISREWKPSHQRHWG